MPDNFTPLNPLDLSSVQSDLPAQSAEDLANWWRRKQDESYQSGYGDPSTGLPTGKALAAGLGSWANALMPGGPEGGFAGIIAGPRALGANLASLAERNELKYEPMNTDFDGNSLSSDKDLWQKTGWFTSPGDNLARWEIPDNQAKLKINDESGLTLDPFTSGKPRLLTPMGKLSDVLDHPELYKNYPHLADTPVSPLAEAWERKGVQGAVFPSGTIAMSSLLDQPTYLSVLLHELQHKVQDTEGFARGGNPDEFLPDDFPQQVSKTRKALQNYVSQFPSLQLFPLSEIKQALDKYSTISPLEPYEKEILQHLADKLGPDGMNDLHEHLIDQATQRARQMLAHKDYQSLAGEVEANLVPERYSQGNYDQYPPETTGYPSGPQIVKFRNGTRGQMIPVDHDPFGEQK